MVRLDVFWNRRAIAHAKSEVDNILIAIRAGIVTPSTKQALEEVERKLHEVELHLQKVLSFQPTQILPRARELHRSMVDQLENIEDVSAAREALRTIVGEIRLVPENGELWAEMTNGGLAAICKETLVAGARFELATFGL